MSKLLDAMDRLDERAVHARQRRWHLRLENDRRYRRRYAVYCFVAAAAGFVGISIVNMHGGRPMRWWVAGIAMGFVAMPIGIVIQLGKHLWWTVERDQSK